MILASYLVCERKFPLAGTARQLNVLDPSTYSACGRFLADVMQPLPSPVLRILELGAVLTCVKWNRNHRPRGSHSAPRLEHQDRGTITISDFCFHQ